MSALHQPRNWLSSWLQSLSLSTRWPGLGVATSGLSASSHVSCPAQSLHCTLPRPPPPPASSCPPGLLLILSEWERESEECCLAPADELQGKHQDTIEQLVWALRTILVMVWDWQPDSAEWGKKRWEGESNEWVGAGLVKYAVYLLLRINCEYFPLTALFLAWSLLIITFSIRYWRQNGIWIII